MTKLPRYALAALVVLLLLVLIGPALAAALQKGTYKGTATLSVDLGGFKMNSTDRIKIKILGIDRKGVITAEYQFSLYRGKLKGTRDKKGTIKLKGPVAIKLGGFGTAVEYNCELKARLKGKDGLEGKFTLEQKTAFGSGGEMDGTFKAKFDD
jgi:hypothetical protein